MKKTIDVNLAQQVRSDYLQYAMSVLIGRAIPNLNDGLKPVQRRILTAMKLLGLKPDGRYMKSARVEGEVMGKYHPHGSSYGAMVTLGAEWNNNLPFIDAHGNWGSSVDPAASSRYTECKLSKFSWECLLANSETWQTAPNYDGSLEEPIELDVKVPALLINGQEGIGVGYATKIPQHSLREICNSAAKGETLYPDFSTGCDIVRNEGLDSYVKTGAGTMLLRARHEIAVIEKQGRKQARTAIAFTNLPPSTNPEKIGQQIKNALESGKLEGVASVIDESDRSGDRLTVIAKPGVDADRLTKFLYFHTDLETSYSARNLCIHNGKPVEYSSARIIAHWKEWRLGRLRVQFAHELDTKEGRLEIVMGLLKALDKIDAVIKAIRAAKSPKEALIALVDRPFKFTADQARAILEMKLRALTNLDAEELSKEKTELEQRLEELKVLIADGKAREGYMNKEIKAIGVRHGEKRRSAIIDPPEVLAVKTGSRQGAAPVSKPRFLSVDMKRGVATQAKGPRGALILEREDKVITLTQDGTLKKLPSNFKGTLSSSYSPVMLARKEREVAERKYLLVFSFDKTLRAMVLPGSVLTKVTSKGKSILPDGASIVHFGEKSFEISWKSSRKKPLTLDLTTKEGKPGGKGIKVANLTDINL